MNLTRLVILLFGALSATFIIVHFGFESDHANTAVKYLHFLKQVREIDFGVSSVSGQPILSEIISRWPATLELGALAMFISIILGIPLGLFAAIHHKKLLDRFLIGFTLIGYSMPTFWLALVLILFFSVGLDLTPVSGRLDIQYEITPFTGFMMIDTLLASVRKQYHFQAFYNALSHLILPAIVLASMPMAVFARMTRTSMLAILSRDYILGARSRGLSKYRVLLNHGLRNALTPILSIGGLHFITTVVMGSIVIELLFGWPGVASYIIQSVYARDYGVVQVFLLSMGMIVLSLNTLIDCIIYWLSPRTVRR